MQVMAKETEDRPESASGPITLYVRLDLPTSNALRAFVESQTVPPSNAAVTVKALHEFLAQHGFWPSRGKRK